MKRLRELRTKAGLTQTQVGELIGVSFVTIARYEAGEREPSHAKISKLADYFGVTVDFLMGRDDFQETAAPDQGWDEAAELFSKLDDQGKEMATQYLRFLAAQQK